MERLSKVLKEMVEDYSQEKETTVAYHLFGIKYADFLVGMSNKDYEKICQIAKVSNNYAKEIYKGVRLAKYVVVK